MSRNQCLIKPAVNEVALNWRRCLVMARSAQWFVKKVGRAMTSTRLRSKDREEAHNMAHPGIIKREDTTVVLANSLESVCDVTEIQRCHEHAQRSPTTRLEMRSLFQVVTIYPKRHNLRLSRAH
jgi:hypothetical protein